MKRKLLTGIIAVTVFAFGVGIVAAKADFSGIWTLDAGKNESLPPGPFQGNPQTALLKTMLSVVTTTIHY